MWALRIPFVWLVLLGAVVSGGYVVVGRYLGLSVGAAPDWDIGLLYILLLYPVTEEIVFRGWIQGIVLRRWDERRYLHFLTSANISTSVLFVLFHLPHHTLPYVLLVLFPSLIFGYVRSEAKSVVPAMLLHIVYNVEMVAASAYL